jgi:polyphosphate kinase 2 (PPK2 family)
VQLGLVASFRQGRTEQYPSIVNLENHLYCNGTQIIKFFLHLSKEEQRKRFLDRIDEPDKNWKFVLPTLKRESSGSII